jgi:hypothetical protein
MADQYSDDAGHGFTAGEDARDPTRMPSRSNTSDQGDDRPNDLIARLISLGRKIGSDISETWNDAVAARAETVLTYREVIDYFVANRPQDADAIRGVLARQPSFAGWTFHLAFTDPAGNPFTDVETGNAIIKIIHAGGCDAELDEMFAGKDLIVFE